MDGNVGIKSGKREVQKKVVSMYVLLSQKNTADMKGSRYRNEHVRRTRTLRGVSKDV